MLPNERFALACRAWYEEQGLIVDGRNGEFAHCPYPEGMGDTGYYLLHEHHQHQGLLQSKDVGRCCFFVGLAKAWLTNCEYWPDNYFELWDIYDEYSKQSGIRLCDQVHAERDESGKSLHAKRSAASTHRERDENGKSLHSLRIHERKDENGKSVNGVKGGKASMREKDADGKSVHAMKMIEANYKEKDENGKSVRATRRFLEKNEEGKSVRALQMNAASNREKNEEGKSVNALKGNASMLKQVWKSLHDGFTGNAGNVAKHNRNNGWDPKARVRIS